MLVFMCSVFPILTLLYLFHSKEKSLFLVSFFSLTFSTLICIFTFLFTFLHRIPEYSFSSNFSYYALNEFVLPLILVFMLYFFCTKDELSYKLNAFFPLAGAFFTVFMPYRIIVANGSVFSFFELFIKPLLFVSLVYISIFFIKRFAKAAVEKNTKKIITCSFFLAFTFFIPPFLNTIWILDWLQILFYVLSILYILAGAFTGLLDTINAD